VEPTHLVTGVILRGLVDTLEWRTPSIDHSSEFVPGPPRQRLVHKLPELVLVRPRLLEVRPLKFRRPLRGNHLKIRAYLHMASDKIRVVQPQQRKKTRRYGPTAVDRENDAARPSPDPAHRRQRLAHVVNPVLVGLVCHDEPRWTQAGSHRTIVNQVHPTTLRCGAPGDHSRDPPPGSAARSERQSEGFPRGQPGRHPTSSM
jgi:hypothetical protein